MTYSLNN